MRESLKRSILDSPSTEDRYPRGSIVICNACARPIYKLDRGLERGGGAGRGASAFKPLTASDLTTLAAREDIDSGVRAMLKSLTPSARTAYLQALTEPLAGDPMCCPVCHGTFPQVLSIGAHEALDKAYTLELLTIRPVGRSSPIRGKRLGYTKDWIH